LIFGHEKTGTSPVKRWVIKSYFIRRKTCTMAGKIAIARPPKTIRTEGTTPITSTPSSACVCVIVISPKEFV
jgi:hypothetical protein